MRVPAYKPPHPLGGPCEHCGAAVKDPKECPKNLELRLKLATGELDGTRACPPEFAGPCCVSDFADEWLVRRIQNDRLIDWYWAFWAATMAAAFLAGRYF